MATVQIRPATLTDMPGTAAVDFGANLDHPVTVCPWAKPEDAPPLFLSHHKYYLDHPQYHFTVATINEKVVGFILYADDNVVDIPYPPLPEGTDQSFFDYFVGSWLEKSAEFDKEGKYEMELLAVLPECRRQGIAAKLVKHLTEILDEKKKGCFLKGSEMAKPLYEKAGWKSLKEWDLDMSKWGYNQPYMSYYMEREAPK